MEEIKLSQASALIPRLIDDTSARGWEKRLQIHDPCIRSYAMTELLGASETLNTKTLRLAMHIAERSGYLRRRLIDLFIRSGFFDSADRLVELEAAQADQSQGLHKALITAMRDGDQRVEVAACHRLFLAEGDPAYLRQAAEVAAGSFGYQVAWPYYLRLLFIEQPSHASRVLDVLRLFEREDAQEHFSRFGKLCEGLKGCEITKAYWQAYRLYWSKDWQRCLDFIERSGVLAATGGLGATFRHLHALCLEKSNRYAEAVQSFEIQNKALAEERYTPEAFIRSLEARRELVILPGWLFQSSGPLEVERAAQNRPFGQ